MNSRGTETLELADALLSVTVVQGFKSDVIVTFRCIHAWGDLYSECGQLQFQRLFAWAKSQGAETGVSGSMTVHPQLYVLPTDMVVGWNVI